MGKDGADASRVWAEHVAEIAEAIRSLPVTVRNDLAPLLREARRLKTELQQVPDGVSAGDICARCGGECCRTGRYHVTVTDILAYLDDGLDPPVPPFTTGFCPYLSVAGCIFPPAYRPFNCITFNCDRIEGLLAPSVQAAFCGGVDALRAVSRSIASLLAGRMRLGILLD